MTTEPSRNNSSNLMDVDDAQSARPALVTVKQAAKSLGVSRSTVYRIDREHGPLRFIISGRWIFIEKASLESYAASRRGIRADDCPLEIKSVLLCQQPATVPETKSHIDELQVVTSGTTMASTSHLASGSGGQRELIMRDHRQPFVVLFFS